MISDEDLVRAANRAFYAAFEAGDLDAMADVWERSERVSVTHPGWPTLQGWPQVAASWEAVFRGTPYIQFVLTDERVQVAGDAAWVTVSENILQSARDEGEGGMGLSGATVAALNLFARRDGSWRLVVHHGSPVATEEEAEG